MQTDFRAEDVIDTLAELFAMHGVPKHVRSDNGPGFIAKAIQRWIKQLDIKALYIEPRSPWQNSYTESFFSRFRDEFLAVEEFESLVAAKEPHQDLATRLQPSSSTQFTWLSVPSRIRRPLC